MPEWVALEAAIVNGFHGGCEGEVFEIWHKWSENGDLHFDWNAIRISNEGDSIELGEVW